MTTNEWVAEIASKTGVPVACVVRSCIDKLPRALQGSYEGLWGEKITGIIDDLVDLAGTPGYRPSKGDNIPFKLMCEVAVVADNATKDGGDCADAIADYLYQISILEVA